MFELFGDALPLPAKFFIAFAVVLALIGLTAWLVRRFGANRLGGANARGRQPRLAVIDAAAVDGRRRLVLIRRDNVEHLLMIGGPTDVVVEQNIVRAATSSSSREPARAEPSLRPTQPDENSWPLQPASEPTPVAPPRPYRAAATEEPWLPPEPGARARPADSNSLAGLAIELSTRLAPPEPPAAPLARSEPPVRANPPPVPPVAAPVLAPEPVATVPPQDDHNLAEMAQQLEAALRRAPMPEPRPPVSDPLAAQAAKPVEAPRAPGRDYKLRIDPKFETRPDTKFEPKFDQRPEPKFDTAHEPRIEARPAEPRQPAPAGKAVFDSLEEEMASLLGRPPGKT
jgi:hypothetical protein